YRRVGWWPLFESWKRALVAAIAEEAAARPGSAAFPLWDFGGFNSLTMERVPLPDDMKSGMRWYVDSSHYSREYGNLILARVLGRPEGARAEDGGMLLDSRNVDAHLREVRQDADAFRDAFPAEAREVGRIMESVRRSNQM